MTLKIHVPFMYFGHYRLSFRKIRKRFKKESGRAVVMRLALLSIKIEI
jgi:hypothetical protein